MAQVQAVQEKRQSLKTVIRTFNEFSSDTTTAQEDGQSTASLEDKSEISDEPELGQIAEGIAETEQPPEFLQDDQDIEEQEVQEESEPSGSAFEEEDEASATEPSTIQDDQAGDERPWQSYLRKDYQNLSLPKAVLKVLQQRPEGVVSVPEIIDAIFVKQTPQPVRATIRTRLSNALSVGLKNQKCYRGKTGQYSISKEAAARAAS